MIGDGCWPSDRSHLTGAFGGVCCAGWIPMTLKIPWHLNLAEAMMRDIRNQEGEDTIGSLIYEMNQKVGPFGSSCRPWDLVQCWAWNMSCKEQLHGSICQLQPVQAPCAALSGRSRKRCRLPQKQCGPWTRSQEKPSKRTDHAGNGYTYIVGRGKTETSRQVSYGFILCL